MTSLGNHIEDNDRRKDPGKEKGTEYIDRVENVVGFGCVNEI